MITLTSGTVIVMWLGELITEYGVGNGVSLIIFSGIIGRLPGSVLSFAQGGGSHIPQLFGIAVIAILVCASSSTCSRPSARSPSSPPSVSSTPRAGAGGAVAKDVPAAARQTPAA